MMRRLLGRLRVMKIADVEIADVARIERSEIRGGFAAWSDTDEIFFRVGRSSLQ
jgi:hypothetical protein